MIKKNLTQIPCKISESWDGKIKKNFFHFFMFSTPYLNKKWFLGKNNLVRGFWHFWHFRRRKVVDTGFSDRFLTRLVRNRFPTGGNPTLIVSDYHCIYDCCIICYMLLSIIIVFMIVVLYVICYYWWNIDDSCIVCTVFEIYLM